MREPCLKIRRAERNYARAALIKKLFLAGVPTKEIKWAVKQAGFEVSTKSLATALSNFRERERSLRQREELAAKVKALENS